MNGTEWVKDGILKMIPKRECEFLSRPTPGLVRVWENGLYFETGMGLGCPIVILGNTTHFCSQHLAHEISGLHQ